MLQQLYENRFSVIIALVLATCIFLAVRKIVKDRKAGIGPCGESCADCPRAAGCDKDKEKRDE